MKTKNFTDIKSMNKKRLIAVALIISLALIATANLTLFNKKVSNVGSSSASAQEPADINSDNVVDIVDLSILLSNWSTNDNLSDINNDNTVDIVDLSILLSKWGTVTIVSARPDASNTGVPEGEALRQLSVAYPDATAKGYYVNSSGRVYISKDGETYENVEFPAGVIIKAQDITIRNSRISGGRSSFSSILDEPTSWADCRSIYLSGQNFGGGQLVDANDSTVANLLIEDTDILINSNEYSAYINNYMGHDTTMRRVDISGGVDAIGIHNAYGPNANFTIEDSFIHDLYKGQWSPGNYNVAPGTSTRMYCGYDEAHPEGNHSDGVQMHDGSNVTIRGNSFFVNAVGTAALNSNAGIMMNNTGNTQIIDNHFRYGVCSINVTSGLGLPIGVSNNTFYGNNGHDGLGTQGDGNCAIIRPSSEGYIINENLWENGIPINLTNG